MPIAKCEKCNIEFENSSKWGIKRFCSRSCGNSRKRPDELRKRVSDKLKGRDVSGVRLLTPEERASRGLKCSDSWKERLLTTDFNSLSDDSKKRRVIFEQNHKCLICGIAEWQGKAIQLAVDHEDGDNKNNSRSNLRGLCPNCHSQTTTYCGRNRNNQTSITDEQLLDALQKNSSIAAALKFFGKSRTSYYYHRCYKLIDKHQIIIK
jgi:hypothetical protein